MQERGGTGARGVPDPARQAMMVHADMDIVDVVEPRTGGDPVFHMTEVQADMFIIDTAGACGMSSSAWVVPVSADIRVYRTAEPHMGAHPPYPCSRGSTPCGAATVRHRVRGRQITTAAARTTRCNAPLLQVVCAADAPRLALKPTRCRGPPCRRGACCA